MNDLYARRLGAAAMHHHLQRMAPVLWRATSVTKEPLNGRFVDEEFMRVNGHRMLHPLIPAVHQQTLHRTHWNDLHETCSWAESGRAQSVRHHTPIAMRAGEVGLLRESLGKVRQSATVQTMMLEQISRSEGILNADTSRQEETEEEEEVAAAADDEPEKLENTDTAAADDDDDGKKKKKK